MERGRKNRTNMKKNVSRDPATVAQTIRRRILLTGGSELASTVAAVDGFAGAAALGGVLTAVVLGADN